MPAFLDLSGPQVNAGLREEDTIFALSSGAPPAGVAVIRISGAGAPDAAELMCGGLPEPRHATLTDISHPRTGELLDRGLALFFPAPASFTGEHVLELQVHGGRAVVGAILTALGELDGFRLAEPGEFTRRAFHSGRMDLTEAEGLGDLVAAETAMQHRLALGQMQGSARRQYEAWRSDLVRVRAMVEAELDFSDEEGVAGSWVAVGRPALEQVLGEMNAALADASRGRALREGAEVVISGPVNAGKSSLINALAKREVAIVSEEAGTTRDLIEVALDLGGYRVTLVDTAGLRETEGLVEREGIRRARQRAGDADLVLWLSDHTGPAEPDGTFTAPVWRIRTKTDLGGLIAGGDHAISAATGAGIPELLEAIRAFLAERLRSGESAVVTRLRHAKALAEAADAIASALASSSSEILAEHLRAASDAIGRVTGRVEVDEILDVVFREFCIGK
ncbi:MAG: tRNA uridine-5-carboxymethylaminomethyl(34) synthesis GTPase MnmE [Bauldia sp.]